jgi:hypothetical protein
MSGEHRHTVASVRGDLEAVLDRVAAIERGDPKVSDSETVSLAKVQQVARRASAYFDHEDPEAPSLSGLAAATALSDDVALLREAIVDVSTVKRSSAARSRRIKRVSELADKLWAHQSTLMQSDIKAVGPAQASDLDQLGGRVAALQRAIAELDARTATLRDNAEERYLKLSEHSASLEGDIASRRQAVERLLADVDERFAQEQKARLDEVRERDAARLKREEQALREFQDAAAERIALLDTALADKRASLDAESEAIVGSLREKHDEASKLVDLVATSSTAGAFGKEADFQRRSANKWRRLALRAFGVAGVATLGFALWSLLADDLEPSLLAAKAAFVVLSLSFGGYASRQSAHHRDREVQARRLYLQLTAFGPFAEPLGDERGREARADFMERLFVGDLSRAGDGKAGGMDDPDFLRQVIGLLADRPGKDRS